MQILKILIFTLAVQLMICGCGKKQPSRQGTESTESEEQTESTEIEKENVSGVTVQWLGHSSFKIRYKDSVIYIDPWKLKDEMHDATLLLISHSHYDHYSPDDITKIRWIDTELVAPNDVVASVGRATLLTPGSKVKLGDVTVIGVAAYNPNASFHPKENNWLGFIIEIGGKRIYYAGDTGLTEEMKALKDIDLALLPVGGTYTMDAAEAAEATKHIKPKMAVPCHYGDIVGSENDAKEFSKLCQCEVKILKPGETLILK